MSHVTWRRPFQGRFVVCRLELAMFNPHTKFEVPMITYNKEMKGNAKCKNSCFEPPFGGLRGNAQGYVPHWQTVLYQSRTWSNLYWGCYKLRVAVLIDCTCTTSHYVEIVYLTLDGFVKLSLLEVGESWLLHHSYRQTLYLSIYSNSTDTNINTSSKAAFSGQPG